MVEISSIEYLYDLNFRDAASRRLSGFEQKMPRYGVVVGDELRLDTAECTAFDLTGFGGKLQMIWD